MDNCAHFKTLAVACRDLTRHEIRLLQYFLTKLNK